MNKSTYGNQTRTFLEAIYLIQTRKWEGANKPTSRANNPTSRSFHFLPSLLLIWRCLCILWLYCDLIRLAIVCLMWLMKNLPTELVLTSQKGWPQCFWKTIFNVVLERGRSSSNSRLLELEFCPKTGNFMMFFGDLSISLCLYIMRTRITTLFPEDIYLMWTWSKEGAHPWKADPSFPGSRVLPSQDFCS